MIEIVTGDMQRVDAEALVTPVYTDGVMSKGLRRAFPAMFDEYRAACQAGTVQIGKMHVWEADTITGPRFIIGFPTKKSLRSIARIADIEAGLGDLVRVVRDRGIASLALPPLGTEGGDLLWQQVRPLIVDALKTLNDVRVLLYEPSR